MKNAETEAYDDAKLHLGLTILSATRALDVLRGGRAVVEVQGDVKRKDGKTWPGQEPPYDDGQIAFIDEELKKIVESAVAARVALGRAGVFFEEAQA